MRVSKEALQERKAWTEWAKSVMSNRCMGCALRPLWLETHEIERRSQAPGRWAHACNYLLLCQNCHMGLFDCMGHAKQLSHKLYWDRLHYDLVAWLKLRDPELEAPLRVTQQEVESHLPLLQDRFG